MSKTSKTILSELHGETLQKLARLVYYQEVAHLKKVAFSSEHERCICLRQSRDAYQSIMNLTNEAQDFREKILAQNQSSLSSELVSNNNEVPFPDWSQFKNYPIYLDTASGYAVTGIENLSIRNSYLNQVTAHAKELKVKMDELRNVGQDSNQLLQKTEELIHELGSFKDTTFEALSMKFSPASNIFAKNIYKPFSKSFPEEVAWFQRKLAVKKGPEYGQPFSDLTDEQKIAVYEEMLEAGGVKVSKFSNAVYSILDGAGKAAIVVTLGQMVYNIVTAEGGVKGKFLAYVENGLEVGAGYVTGAITEYAVVGVGLAFVEAASVLGIAVSLGAFVLATAVGFIAAEAISYLFHKKVISEAKHPTASQTRSHPFPMLSIYAPPTTDAVKLANRLAYKG